MKKQFIIGFLSGALVFGAIGALAAGLTANINPFMITLNGDNVFIEGYNIEGSTYFKLRDIADVVGGFDVDFVDNVITLTTDDYIPSPTPAPVASPTPKPTVPAEFKEAAEKIVEDLAYEDMFYVEIMPQYYDRDGDPQEVYQRMVWNAESGYNRTLDIAYDIDQLSSRYSALPETKQFFTVAEICTKACATLYQDELDMLFGSLEMIETVQSNLSNDYAMFAASLKQLQDICNSF